MPQAGMNPRIDGFSRMRYCGVGNGIGSGMNWHGDDHNGQMYRCCCMPQFRLPGGRTGPNSSMLRRKGAAERMRGDKLEHMRDWLDRASASDSAPLAANRMNNQSIK